MVIAVDVSLVTFIRALAVWAQGCLQSVLAMRGVVFQLCLIADAVQVDIDVRFSDSIQADFG